LKPQKWIAQPFLLGEAKQVFDLRAYIELILVFVQRAHERDRGNLLDQRTEPRLRGAAFGFGAIARRHITHYQHEAALAAQLNGGAAHFHRERGPIAPLADAIGRNVRYRAGDFGSGDYVEQRRVGGAVERLDGAAFPDGDNGVALSGNRGRPLGIV
jgi:hypothetical protein